MIWGVSIHMKQVNCPRWDKNSTVDHIQGGRTESSASWENFAAPETFLCVAFVCEAQTSRALTSWRKWFSPSKKRSQIRFVTAHNCYIRLDKETYNVRAGACRCWYTLYRCTVTTVPSRRLELIPFALNSLIASYECTRKSGLPQIRTLKRQSHEPSQHSKVSPVTCNWFARWFWAFTFCWASFITAANRAGACAEDAVVNLAVVTTCLSGSEQRWSWYLWTKPHTHITPTCTHWFSSLVPFGDSLTKNMFNTHNLTGWVAWLFGSFDLKPRVQDSLACFSANTVFTRWTVTRPQSVSLLLPCSPGCIEPVGFAEASLRVSLPWTQLATNSEQLCELIQQNKEHCVSLPRNVGSLLAKLSLFAKLFGICEDCRKVVSWGGGGGGSPISLFERNPMHDFRFEQHDGTCNNTSTQYEPLWKYVLLQQRNTPFWPLVWGWAGMCVPPELKRYKRDGGYVSETLCTHPCRVCLGPGIARNNFHLFRCCTSIKTVNQHLTPSLVHLQGHISTNWPVSTDRWSADNASFQQECYA